MSCMYVFVFVLNFVILCDFVFMFQLYVCVEVFYGVVCFVCVCVWSVCGVM